MTRTTLKIPGLAALAIAATLAAPTAASALPDRTGSQTHTTTSTPVAPTAHPVGQPWLSPDMHRVGQPWPTQSVDGGSVPTARVTTTVVHSAVGPSSTVSAEASGDGFGWTDALVGFVLTTSIMALALAGALVVRRRLDGRRLRQPSNARHGPAPGKVPGHVDQLDPCRAAQLGHSLWGRC